MTILTISRPPARRVFSKFYQRRDQLADKLENRGHRVIRFRIKPRPINNLYLAYGLGVIAAYLKLMFLEVDIVISDDLESALVGVALKTFRRLPFVFCFRDDYSLIAYYNGRPLQYLLTKWAERIIPRLATLVVATDHKKMGYCRKIGIAPDKISLVPNGVDVHLFQPGPEEKELRRRYGLFKERVIFFRGKINRYYRLDTILKAASIIVADSPQIKFLLVGEGDDLDRLKKMADNLRITNQIIFTGFVPQEALVELIRLADLCVYPLPNSSALALYEYMSCAKPFVIPRGGTEKMDVSDVFEKAAVLVENSPQGFAQGIKYLLKNPKKAREMGWKGRQKVLQCYQWEQVVGKLEGYLLGLVGRKSRN